MANNMVVVWGTIGRDGVQLIGTEAGKLIYLYRASYPGRMTGKRAGIKSLRTVFGDDWQGEN